MERRFMDARRGFWHALAISPRRGFSEPPHGNPATGQRNVNTRKWAARTALQVRTSRALTALKAKKSLRHAAFLRILQPFARPRLRPHRLPSRCASWALRPELSSSECGVSRAYGFAFDAARCATEPARHLQGAVPSTEARSGSPFRSLEGQRRRSLTISCAPSFFDVHGVQCGVCAGREFGRLKQRFSSAFPPEADLQFPGVGVPDAQ